MRNLRIRVGWAGLAFAWLAVATTAAGQNAVGLLSCGMDFEVAVRHGPSKGLRLKGDLYFSFDRTGSLKGDFTPAGGGRVPVVGQVQGNLIGLVFDFSGEHVWGTGTGVRPIFGLDCGEVVGGTFAGPKDGDLGDWIAKSKPPQAQEN